MIEILQVRSEAYSSWSEKNVNDSDHKARCRTQLVGSKNVDSKEDRQRAGCARASAVQRCGKAEEGSGKLGESRI